MPPRQIPPSVWYQSSVNPANPVPTRCQSIVSLLPIQCQSVNTTKICQSSTNPSIPSSNSPQILERSNTDSCPLTNHWPTYANPGLIRQSITNPPIRYKSWTNKTIRFKFANPISILSQYANLLPIHQSWPIFTNLLIRRSIAKSLILEQSTYTRTTRPFNATSIPIQCQSLTNMPILE